MMPFALLIFVFLTAPAAAPQLPPACVPAPARTGEAGPDVPDAWLAQVTEDIRRGEYGFSPLRPGVFSAPNRAQELRSRVSAQGLELFPRSAGADGDAVPWRLELRTKSFGRTNGSSELAPAALEIHGERVELDHGPLLEWLENRADGLEQGWTIAARPAGREPLWIGLELGGDLALRIQEGGRSGVLVDAAGEARLSYTGLRAFDARGRELEARLLPAQGGVGILVEDAGARYPLTVDPRLRRPAWTAEADQASASFGESVATAGDVNGDGYADVIVGAPWFDHGQTDEGRAYVFRGSASGLSSSPAWTAESNQAATRFGISVASAGDVNGDGYSDVIIGAPDSSNGQTSEGRAYVFHGSASGLGASPAWTAESDQTLALFGITVASAGDVNGDGYSDVIIGASWWDDDLQPAEGHAFVYHGSAGGLAASPAWTVEGDQPFAFLGLAVGTAGDVNGDGYADVIVGLHSYTGDQSGEGGAWVYYGSTSGLPATPSWTAEGDQVDAHFGSSVSTAGDVNGDGYSDVIVGAHLYDNGEVDEGGAFVYLGSSSGLVAFPAWTAEGDQAGANLGNSVASAGDVNGDGYSDVIVGAPFFHNGQNNEGQARVYLGSASGLAASPARTRESNQALAYFGWCVATAGDVNGDGTSEVIVGAPGFDDGEAEEGRAYVFH